MIPEIREAFNARFDPHAYEAMVNEINSKYKNSLVFRVAETPIFLTNEFIQRLNIACSDILKVLMAKDYREKVKNAIPPELEVANEDEHTTFLQLDFAICKDEKGEYSPQLIELQGFPSLYAFQHYLDSQIRKYFDIPEPLTPFFSGLDSQSYKNVFGKVLLGDSDPENVILLELEPEKQKTRIDFFITEEYYGIPQVCITDLYQKGDRLFYRQGRREIPVERIYYRFIFDELIRKNVQCGFDIHADLDVVWVGHPNWFFKISKYTLPLIDSPYCPPCYFLKDLSEYPGDLENYVLKPLFSFAGHGVEIDVTPELLENLPDKENYILQKKIEYAPFLKTPDELAKAEIRMMFIWDDAPMLVNNLVRISKGKMMGVDYNRNKSWVGSSLGYHFP